MPALPLRPDRPATEVTVELQLAGVTVKGPYLAPLAQSGLGREPQPGCGAERAPRSTPKLGIILN